MELQEAVFRRRMVRSYDAESTVSDQIVKDLLRLAIRAPSAGHTQGWRFLVLDDITSRSRFWQATAAGQTNGWLDRLQSAPVLIMIFGDRDAYLDRYTEPDKGWTDRSVTNWPVPYWDVDAAMAAMLILLGAQEAGLGACFFGLPADRVEAVRDTFAVPPAYSPIGVISLGYPAADIRSPSLSRPRLGLDDVVRYTTY